MDTEGVAAPAEVAADTNGHADEAPSILDTIRERREAIEEGSKELLTLPVPGYEGSLQARYKRVRAVGIARMTLGEDSFETYADLLIRACEEVVVMVDGELVGLHIAVDQFNDGEPIRWGDERLASALNLKDYTGKDGAPRARKIILAAHGGDENLVVRTGIALAGWLLRTNAEGDAGFE